MISTTNAYVRRACLGVCMAGLAVAAAPTAAQFRVEISGVGGTQIPVAIPPLRDQAQSGQPIAEIVRADLTRSGLFKITNSNDALDETTPPLMSYWRSRGTDALLAGSVSRLADGRYDLRYRLWDVVKGQPLMAQSEAAQAIDLRSAAHRIADNIYEKLVGDKGVFSTRIAYVAKAGSRYTLHVADADGEGAQTMLSSAEPIISPAWSPDGRELAYVSFERQKAVVWVQEITSGKRRVVANFRGSNSAPAWSPDGQQMAVTLSRDGNAQIYLVSRNGDIVRRLTASSSIDTEPVFAPDGVQLYFVSDRSGGPQIYRAPVAGGPVERVTFTGGYNVSPAISPDGRYMAYISRQGNALRLFLMELSGDAAARGLTDTNDDERPSFAPNSRLIIYATRLGGRDVLMTTTLDGGIKTSLAVTQADAREPVWGPFVH